jgi:selenocysteine-specific elongation factor
VPERLKREHPEETADLDAVQLTLVDCPGHASLIRTIIGGAQIIDMVILVVDVTHGIQTQTAECIIIAEVTTSHMIIVLNKVRAPVGRRIEVGGHMYRRPIRS